MLQFLIAIFYCNLQPWIVILSIGIRKSTIGWWLKGGTMIGRTLKYVIVALAALMSCMQAAGCPTCLGKLRMSDKEPFFKRYRPHRRPHSRSIYAKKRDELLRKALSYKKTKTSTYTEKGWSTQDCSGFSPLLWHRAFKQLLRLVAYASRATWRKNLTTKTTAMFSATASAGSTRLHQSVAFAKNVATITIQNDLKFYILKKQNW